MYFRCLENVLAIMLLTIMPTLSHSAPDNCNAGYYLSQAGLCEPCLVGTFRSQADQVYHCEICRVADESKNEATILPCTATNNTVIGCKSRFYTIKNDIVGVHCVPCSVCGLGSNLYKDYEVRECSQYEDVACCPESWDVLLAGVCKDRRGLPTTPVIATHALENQPSPTSSVVGDGQPEKAELRNLSGGSKSLLLYLPCKLILLLIFIWFHTFFLRKPL